MTAKKQATLPKKPRARGELFTRYDALVAQGNLQDDPAQRMVVGHLQELHERLLSKTGKKGLLDGFFGKTPAQAPKSLYIWGNVGRGKSMLMELFYEQVPAPQKRRVHFHAFMQEVHARIHALRQQAKGDPVALLAHEIAQEVSLLCFDELQATDVADATLLYRLFEGLFEAGIIIVSTSNHPPATLYTGGVQRERFFKFIALLESHMDIVALSSPADYRHLQMKSLEQVYFSPPGPTADAFIERVLETLGAGPAQDVAVNIQGRALHFALYGNSIGRFTFAQLCEAALGPADYLAIANMLDTVILTGIPKLPVEKRNEAKRFVTLIDALYEAGVKLIATAEAPPAQIYEQGDGSFEFARTVSRLAEMQSQSYLSSI